MQRNVTENMVEQLNADISMTEFFDQNAKDFLDVPLSQYLKMLIDKSGSTKANIIKQSGINRRFFFDILSGKRNPTRDYVLRILLTLQLPLKNVQWLLRATGYAQLYARDRRDSVIMYCIMHQFSASQCNEMLGKIDLNNI